MSPKEIEHRVKILLIEDDFADARLTVFAFQQCGNPPQVTIVPDGAEGLAMLRREGKYAKAIVPDLLLVDLNMPKVDGREVLSIIKGDEALKHLPVVILTTSDDEQDVRYAYEQQANAYVTKPADIDEFLSAVHCIERFWCATVRMPSKTNEVPANGV